MNSTPKTVEPEWYDEHFPDPAQKMLFPPDLKESPYYEMYEVVKRFVPSNNSVIELGCGDGRFASLIIANHGGYRGYDFSQAALNHAREYNPGYEDHFIYADLRSLEIPEANTYVSLEVMEHIEDDLGLIERIPRNSFTVISVPSFDSASHLRFFPTEGSAIERYCQVLDIDDWRKVKIGETEHYFHVFRGRR